MCEGEKFPIMVFLVLLILLFIQVVAYVYTLRNVMGCVYCNLQAGCQSCMVNGVFLYISGRLSVGHRQIG